MRPEKGGRRRSGMRVAEAGAEGMNRISESARSAGEALAATTEAVADKVRE